MIYCTIIVSNLTYNGAESYTLTHSTLKGFAESAVYSSAQRDTVSLPQWTRLSNTANKGGSGGCEQVTQNHPHHPQYRLRRAFPVASRPNKKFERNIKMGMPLDARRSIII